MSRTLFRRAIVLEGRDMAQICRCDTCKREVPWGSEIRYLLKIESSGTTLGSAGVLLNLGWSEACSEKCALEKIAAEVAKRRAAIGSPSTAQTETTRRDIRIVEAPGDICGGSKIVPPFRDFGPGPDGKNLRGGEKCPGCRACT